MLERYHNKGEVVPWVNFFLEGVATVAERAIETSRSINRLREEDIAKIHTLGGSRSKTGMVVLKNLYRLPIVNVRKIEEWAGLSRPSANALVQKLVEVGILEQRDRECTVLCTMKICLIYLPNRLPSRLRSGLSDQRQPKSIFLPVSSEADFLFA